jgi:hypothetical protein
MPGDKRPDHNPDIGRVGRLELLVLVVIGVLIGIGWHLF